MLDKIIHSWLRVPYTLHVTVDRKVKKARATVIFIHGIGLSARSWDQVVEQTPADVRVITIDLLGFGKSPKPHWAIYNVHLQARMIIATILRLGIRGPVILVGHSLGALVSVELAKRYPLLVRSLILCSPPFYKPDATTKRLVPHADKVLKDIYKAIQKYPDQFIKISQLAVKYGLVNKGFSLTKDDAHGYMGALEASIINQTSLEDAIKLNKRMRIIHGALDAVVIKRNLKYLVRHNPKATLTTVVAGHEVRGVYISAVIASINEATSAKIKQVKKRERAQV